MDNGTKLNFTQFNFLNRYSSVLIDRERYRLFNNLRKKRGKVKSK